MKLLKKVANFLKNLLTFTVLYDIIQIQIKDRFKSIKPKGIDTMANKTEKMTVVKALTYALENCVLPDDVKDKFEDMRTKAQNKTSGTKTGENAALYAEIGEELLAFMEQGKEYTLAELIAGVMQSHFDEVVSSSRASTIIRPLADANQIIRGKSKGKATYHIANPGEVNPPKPVKE